MCAEESAGEFVTRGACKVEEACQSVRWSITPPGTTAIARLILYQIGFNWILKCFCVCVRLNFWESPSRVANFDSLLHPWQGEWVFPWHWQEQPEKKETCETLLNDRSADTALSGSHCFFSSNNCIISFWNFVILINCFHVHLKTTLLIDFGLCNFFIFLQHQGRCNNPVNPSILFIYFKLGQELYTWWFPRTAARQTHLLRIWAFMPI